MRPYLTDAEISERERQNERQMRELYEDVLERIARGRTDCGRPLAAETARQLARRVLLSAGRSWSKALR